ncbi:ABC transporter ATP-binding protein [Demequina sp. TTPB684]|uniref:ABC transporter ATP-binding protein n=1 Tax=unclassified Demequina TaxID=2620311 RepID=UPI001CF4F20E|nr:MULTISPECIES: ABC transporter ATP-binding protein [unclassified Demequina]MCB2413508.1 ABC transporter ATP-binding protein [Demequina sp. TTPB684]UPU87172.1 ABC transporter ATP-binding protein [Demequina sp. TMPB413]
MNAIVEVNHLTKRFGKVEAVSDVSFSFEREGIHGLLGRNGAGKTTLMKLMTGQEFATAGDVKIFGQSPVENAAVLDRVCFINEAQVYPEDFKGRHALTAASHFFGAWDDSFAARLVEDFAPPLGRPIKKMSRGQRSAIGVIIGLASRAELTYFDEPYAGLDAVARQMFYDHLLADYAERPRTVVLSTHLIDEASNLLERVVVVDDGTVLIDAEAEDLRSQAATLVGGADAVHAFAAGREVLGVQQVGGIASVTVAGLDDAELRSARDAGLEVGPVSLQQLIVSRTGGRTVDNNEGAVR